MIGADICGFIDNTTEELCARWIEVGAFYPFSRDHSAIGTIPQELYVWDTVAAASRTALGMRYQMLPYIYTLFYNAHTSGSLVARALWANFPGDPVALTIDYQFMLGDAIMVSPVVDQYSTNVNAYFPAGLWYNFNDRSFAFDTNAGGVYHSLYTPLTSSNVHVLGGNVLPLQDAAMTTVAGRQTPFTFLVALNKNGHATGSLFWDDGEQINLDNVLSMNIDASSSTVGGSVYNTILTSTYADADLFTLNTIVVLGTSSMLSSPSKVTLNGAALSSSQFSYNSSKGSLTITSLNLKLSKTFTLKWN
jgi:alpha-glucosidase (family GH31 glycosyl hydrolase)